MKIKGAIHEALFARSMDMLGTATLDGRFEELNPAWQRVLGFSLEELRAQPYIDLVHPDDRERTLAEARALAEGKFSPVFLNRYRCKDGSYRWIEWNTQSAPEEGRTYFVARDVTERINAEEEARERAAQLERERIARKQMETALAWQKRTIEAMSTPVLQVWQGVLAVPVIGHVDETRAAMITEQLLAEIVRTSATFTILDLTGVENVDAVTGSHLMSIVRAASLLGSRCVMSGIRPAIARTMIEVGARTVGLESFATLKAALAYALMRSEPDARRAAR
jgi:rsbT co-antagonist protein RsbR